MGALLGLTLGTLVAVLGFVAMRNPIRFAHLAPGAEGYYQRLMLDEFSRVGLRSLAALVSLFGLVIFAGALGGLLKMPLLHFVSDAFLELLSVLFVVLWFTGVVVAIVQATRRRSLDWFRLWRRGIELGPVDVYPPMTPVMEKEARRFTWAFCGLVGLAICRAIYHR
jgi:hypothetical protein